MKDLTGNGVGSEKIPHKQIILQDFNDLCKAEIVLWNAELYGETRQSFGSHYELSWAWMLKKRVIAIASLENFVARNHPFVTQTVEAYFEKIWMAINYVTGNDRNS
jgi:hypothetical protein